MGLSQIIDVSITRNTAAADRATFGTPLFVTETVPAGFTERVRSYTSLEAMTDDGFVVTDNAYLAGQAFFSQNPAVTELFIGRKDAGDADWVAAVIAIREENDDWFVLTTEEHTQADVLALAAYIEAIKKMYFVSTEEAPSIDSAYDAGVTTDTAAKLIDLGYDNTVHYWHNLADTTFPECAFAGYNLPFVAGKATWAYLQLKGVAQALNTDGNPLTTTQANNLLARNSNFSQKISGITVTREGKVVGGEWIDVIRGSMALEEDMEKSLFDLLINQQGGKVPYDDSGLNLVRSVMQDSLNRFVDSNFISGDFKIFIPKASDIPFVDKTNRILQNVTFEAYLIGAIHTIKISGNITYS